MSLQLKRFASRSVEFDPAWIGFNGLFTDVPREVINNTPSIGIYQVKDFLANTIGTFGFSITPWGVVQELPNGYEAHIQSTFITVGPAGHTLDNVDLTFAKTVAIDYDATGGVLRPDAPFLAPKWQLNGVRQFEHLDRQSLGVYPAHAVEALLWALRRLKKAGKYRMDRLAWDEDSLRSKSMRELNQHCLDIRHILSNSCHGPKQTRVPITPEIFSYCVRVEHLVGTSLLTMEVPRRAQAAERSLRMVAMTYGQAKTPSSSETLFDFELEADRVPRLPLTDVEAMEWAAAFKEFVDEARAIQIPVLP